MIGAITGDIVGSVYEWARGAAERHRRALDEFHETHRHADEAVIVTPESFERDVPDLAE